MNQMFLFFLLLTGTTSLFAEQLRPNILWISCEDISPHIGCYGDPHAITPHIDQLAREGVRFTHAFTTAGVCAPCRSGIITGMYQTTLGTHHMRCNAQLPSFVKPFPHYLRKAGYYCTNNSKQDYQFKTPSGTWDESSGKAHWRNRTKANQPFFSVFNFTGCHESGIASSSKYQSVTKKLTPQQRQSPRKLSTLPPYYPDTPIAREDWKRNYELITAMDQWAGDLISQLKADGLYEETIIFFWSDHGVGLPRAKRWLYDSGTHIPLVVRIPKKFRSAAQGKAATVSNQLVSSIDFAPTVLNLCSLSIPKHIQGQPFLGKNLPMPRQYIFGARDRMDERYDIIRMVRNNKYRYIRNYEPLKTYYQYMNTPEKGATMKELRRLHEAGTLPETAELYFASRKPVEELYDTEADPHEIHNLIDDPAFHKVLEEMRKAHLQWVRETKDLGLIAEPIIIEKERQAGSRYQILRQSDGTKLSNDIAEVAVLASAGPQALPKLLKAIKHQDAAVRYWGATGIGNLGAKANGIVQPIQTLLKDQSAAVRIAAARAMLHRNRNEQSPRNGNSMSDRKVLELLIQELHQGAEWEQLHAAIVLDEINELAKPVVDEMRKSLSTKVSKNKYVIRIINRALNELEGTNRAVR